MLSNTVSNKKQYYSLKIGLLHFQHTMWESPGLKTQPLVDFFKNVYLDFIMQLDLLTYIVSKLGIFARSLNIFVALSVGTF